MPHHAGFELLVAVRPEVGVLVQVHPDAMADEQDGRHPELTEPLVECVPDVGRAHSRRDPVEQQVLALHEVAPDALRLRGRPVDHGGAAYADSTRIGPSILNAALVNSSVPCGLRNWTSMSPSARLTPWSW